MVIVGSSQENRKNMCISSVRELIKVTGYTKVRNMKEQR